MGVLADKTGENLQLAARLVGAFRQSGLRTALNQPYDLSLAGAGENPAHIQRDEAYYPIQFLGQLHDKPYVLLEFAQEGLLDHPTGVQKVSAALIHALRETDLL